MTNTTEAIDKTTGFADSYKYSAEEEISFLDYQYLQMQKCRENIERNMNINRDRV